MEQFNRVCGITLSKKKFYELICIFGALEVIFAFSYVGYFMLQDVSSTILHIFVIVAAMMCGIRGAIPMAAIFALTSMWAATMAVTPADQMFSPFISGNPAGSVMLGMLRILFAVITSGIYRFYFSKKRKHIYLGISFIAILSTVLYFILILAGIHLFFPDIYGLLVRNFNNLPIVRDLWAYLLAAVCVCLTYYSFSVKKIKSYFTVLSSTENNKKNSIHRQLYSFYIAVGISMLLIMLVAISLWKNIYKELQSAQIILPDKTEWYLQLNLLQFYLAFASAMVILSIVVKWIKEYYYLNKNYINTYKQLNVQYTKVLELLRKMKCMLVEYDNRTGKIKVYDSLKKVFDEEFQEDFFDRIDEYKKIHPEFDVDGMCKEKDYVIQYKVTRSFDSIYKDEHSVYKMVSMIMMPILDEDGKVVTVLGSVREANEEHRELDNMLSMFQQIPGGTYRCTLDKFPCYEYVGERICKMLGYTTEEFNDSVGNQYVNAILEEDKEEYLEFIREAAKTPGVRGCQYRLKCKNGDTISVLDTMESLKKSYGVIYGYSVIIDISEYAKRQNIIRQEIKQMEASMEMLRVQNSTSQMQPHFLYNALASIRELILIDAQYASDLVCDFTTYLRACIRTMQDGRPIPISQEIENIRAYTNIEKMRMGEKLKVVFDLRAEEFKIVPLSIQPLVENAIRHGIFPKGRKGGTVTIRTESFPKYNCITVQDDGVGFDYQKVRDEVEKGIRDSIGLDNVIFRLKKQLQAEIVIRSQDGEGTIITIHVPKNESGGVIGLRWILDEISDYNVHSEGRKQEWKQQE